MTSVLEYRSKRIVELLDEPAELRDADWLKEALQQAVMLELATLPPYLCGLWSIDDSARDGEASSAIGRIVFDEMSHLGLAGNLLTTVGGVPRLADARAVPAYPGPLPGGVRPELTVFLSGLSKDSLDLYSRIEEPDRPVAAAETHTSIGAFYTAVLEAFRSHPDLITGGHQLTRNMPHHGEGNNVGALRSLADVEAAIGVIKEQGEGTSASPENPHPGEPEELAHFYVFREIFHGRKLVRTAENPDRWEFAGAEIPMPPALPMGRVPSGGWGTSGPLAPDPETRQLLDAVNRTYSQMLRFLEAAWQADLPATAKELLNKAVGQMFALQDPARAAMRRPLPDGSGRTYGPEFLFTDG
ncbi:ferritin-like protein [Streptomyces spinoverrucosus]|uniref:ferritin-like domain-containing protein n=1 Tax=Streptomyces spinoverrucosus TaxID=284043 RepID=UPI0018C3D6FA|nr:ferritin-like protein [Streptomyces spinoverrucosus]MBG0850626.1 ferritin-like protein [Streptomyces spinoverrucosus]